MDEEGSPCHHLGHSRADGLKVNQPIVVTAMDLRERKRPETGECENDAERAEGQQQSEGAPRRRTTCQNNSGGRSTREARKLIRSRGSGNKLLRTEAISSSDWAGSGRLKSVINNGALQMMTPRNTTVSLIRKS